MDLSITPLTATVGASVAGIRLDSLDDTTFGALQAAFQQHLVLVFKDQHIKPATHVEFAQRWGTPVVTAMLENLQVDGHPEIVQVRDIPKETTSTEYWHYDAPFTETPPKISILSALKVPPGGDTMWSNQYEAYERLSDGLKRTLEGLRVTFRGNLLGRMLNVAPEDIPQATHPLVRTHPETGRRALYVGYRANAICVDGWTPEESRPLLDYLYNFSSQPDNTYRHRWDPGDVVMWDNRCTMHYAIHGYGNAERILNRITLAGETPA